MKGLRNLFRLKKSVKEGTIRYIIKLFELKENYYKPVRGGNFYRNNYNEYKGNSDRNKTQTIKEYPEEITP